MYEMTEIGYRPNEGMDGYVPLAVFITGGAGIDAPVASVCVANPAIKTNVPQFEDYFRDWPRLIRSSASMAITALKSGRYGIHEALRKTHAHRIRAGELIGCPDDWRGLEIDEVAKRLFEERIAAHPYFSAGAGEPVVVIVQ